MIEKIKKLKKKIPKKVLINGFLKEIQIDDVTEEIAKCFVIENIGYNKAIKDVINILEGKLKQ